MRHRLAAVVIVAAACVPSAAPPPLASEPAIAAGPTPQVTASALATVAPTAPPAFTPTPSATSSPTPTPAPTFAPTAAPSPTAAPIRYVAIGASDSVGVGASDPQTGSWPALLSNWLPAGATYTNLGVSGSLASQARVQQLPAALAAKPTLVTIWLAVNDLNALVPTATYGAELGAIVDALVAGTEARVFVGTVPDLRAVPLYAVLDPQVLLARVTAYNDQIARIAARHPTRVRVVDLFTGSAALVSAGTVAEDGFHPSDAGYALIADRFAAALVAAGVALR